MTAPKRTGGRASSSKATEPIGYFEQSRRPLQILVFLLPLIITYELGLLWLLRSEAGTLTNRAHGAIVNFLDAFGVLPAGLYLGGAAIVVVLLAWHMLAHDRWEIDLRAAMLMVVESMLLALPLVAVGQLIARAIPAAAVLAVASDSTIRSLETLPPVHAVVISFGAGLYEELLFRMILIAALHTLLVDVCGATQRVGATIAIVVSAAAFAAYHPLQTAAGDIAWANLAFFFAAGLYFGAAYVIRGFGIVVGIHAIYDVLAIWLLPAMLSG